MCEQLASYESSEEEARVEDRIRATVHVSVDGMEVEDASFSEPTLIQIGANIPALDKNLAGLMAGADAQSLVVVLGLFTAY